MSGGFAPCPIPCGGTATVGRSAEQWDRITADLVALVQVSAFAVLQVSVTASGATLNNYAGMNGEGSAFAPTVTRTGAGVTDVVWAASYEDDYERREPTHVRAPEVGVNAATNTEGFAHTVTDRRQYTVETHTVGVGAADLDYTLIVY